MVIPVNYYQGLRLLVKPFPTTRALKGICLGADTMPEDFLLTLKEPVTYNAPKKGGGADEHTEVVILVVSLSVDFLSSQCDHVC